MPVLVVIFMGLTAVSWLVPNHYPPWLAAWNDGLAIAGMLLLSLSIGLLANGSRRIDWRLPAIGALCLTMVLAQLASGRLFFAGDALMVILYLGVWFIAVITGGLMAADSRNREFLSALAACWVIAAIISVGIAINQLTCAVDLHIYAADMPPGGRPFGNVAQPNHLCTLCFVGLCGLFWLHQSEKISGATLLLGAFFLILGMVASQSRAGWLQFGLLVVWGLAQRERSGLRATRGYLMALGGVYVAGIVLWPSMLELVLLAPGRSLGDQMTPGIRLPFWWAMLDAIGREPLLGYGWQQIGAAQQRVALDHQPMGALFDHSHNFVLDILLWNGLFVGGLILAILAWWFIDHIHACRNAGAVWLLAAVAGVFAHAMVEFPLAYAYFLIPVGLAMGAIEQLSPTGRAQLPIPKRAMLGVTLLFGALFFGVALEYMKTEERFRALRFELARIGATQGEISTAGGGALTQLDAFLKYYRTEAKPGMSSKDLDWMRKVSERYGFSTVLLRYALATSLNGQPDVAGESLARICRIHQPRRCDEALETWVALQVIYPQLSAVAMPARSAGLKD